MVGDERHGVLYPQVSYFPRNSRRASGPCLNSPTLLLKLVPMVFLTPSCSASERFGGGKLVHVHGYAATRYHFGLVRVMCGSRTTSFLRAHEKRYMGRGRSPTPRALFGRGCRGGGGSKQCSRRVRGLRRGRHQARPACHGDPRARIITTTSLRPQLGVVLVQLLPKRDLFVAIL